MLEVCPHCDQREPAARYIYVATQLNTYESVSVVVFPLGLQARCCWTPSALLCQQPPTRSPQQQRCTL